MLKEDEVQHTCWPVALTPPSYRRESAPCSHYGRAGMTADHHGLQSVGTLPGQLDMLKTEN